ncbi:MAG: AAA family ATPase [bacterium]|jgi:lon-related putative ATP-dependent protease|nr:AAA family ATPase [bacterium]MDD4558421.1 AAA family ATPase [bacterium]
MNKINEVPVENLRHYVNPEQFDFETTKDIAPLTGTVGQERAISALNFGFNIKTGGFNIYAAGAKGTGKNSTIKAFVHDKARQEDPHCDWVYVNNFKETDKPKTISVPTGKGPELAADMDQLIAACKEEIPRAFENEDYDKRKSEILKDVQKRRDEILTEIQAIAENSGFIIEMTNMGIVTVPAKKGKPMSRDEFEALDKDEKDRLQDKLINLQTEIGQAQNKARKLEQEAEEKIRSLDKEVALFAIGHLLDRIRDDYKECSKVIDYLGEVQNDIIEHLDNFKHVARPEGATDGQLALMQALGQGEPTFDQYKVNVFITNGHAEGAPVVIENNPTYYNLIGRIDYDAKFGVMTTNFNLVKPGAIHRANGGYLVLQALDLLMNFQSWDALKRVLRSGEITIENIGDQYRPIPTSTLKPEPIPVNVKVILIGNPMIYHLLYAYDEDFPKLFKVKADFGPDMNRNDEHIHEYASFITARVNEAGLKHFHKSGVARIVEYGSRLIENQKKLSTRFIEISDIISEASYWADKDNSEYVMARHVEKALYEKKYRSSMIEERLQEMINEGTLLIDTEGAVVGQVNGLSVLDIGDYMFGKPSRITAKTFVGRSGVTNIERETAMGGPIHNKGVMILTGYLGSKFAVDKPLALSASITFEQEYGGVEGDSASSTELYAILSSLAEVPIRQNLAVTGSVNQKGEIQPIGGVNQKIEGFFDVCRLRGLTGDQGIMIPHQNVKHLMLRNDIIEAVKNGSFHIFPVKSIDEGIEILTGMEAGARDENGKYPENSIFGKADNKIQQFTDIMRIFGGGEETEERKKGKMGMAAEGIDEE